MISDFKIQAAQEIDILLIDLRDEQKEFYDIYPNLSEYTRYFADTAQLFTTILYKGIPVLVVGLLPNFGNCYELIMFVDKRFPEIIKDHRRSFYQVCKDYLNQVNNPDIRIQCTVRSDFLIGQRFVQHLGFKPEGEMRSFGIKGNDVIRYSYLVGDRSDT